MGEINIKGNYPRKQQFKVTPFGLTEVGVMTVLRFTDGMKFITGGELRATERGDGWYVVGQGMLIPVVNKEEANRIIESFKAHEASKSSK